MGWLGSLAKLGATIGAGALGGPLAAAAVGGAASGLESQNRMEEQKRQNRAKAEANRYAPLTGNWQNMQRVNNTVLSDTLGGGLMAGIGASKLGMGGASGGVSEAGTVGAAGVQGSAVNNAMGQGVGQLSPFQQMQQQMLQNSQMANPYTQPSNYLS